MSQFNHLIDILKFRAEHQPDDIAYRFLRNGDNDEVTVTYSQLYDRSRIIASFIQSQVNLHERVVLLYEPGLEFICAFFACFLAGVIAVPAYPPNPYQLTSSLAKLEILLEDATPKLICCSPRVLSLLRITHVKAAINNWLARLRGKERSHLLLERIDTINTETLHKILFDLNIYQPQSDDTAYLQYSSGSTGNPKGIMISHENIMSNSFAIQNAFQHTRSSSFLSWLPPYHDMGLLGGIVHPFFVGFTCTQLSPLNFIQNPLHWLRLIERYQATSSCAPNFAYAMCAKLLRSTSLKFNLSSWRVAICGAEPINESLMEEFCQLAGKHQFNGNAFHPTYGLAEHTLIVTGASFQSGLQSISKHESPIKNCSQNHVNCGAVIPDHEIFIVNPDSHQILAEETVGEIWLRGPSVAKGYWKNKKATTEIFQAFTQDIQGPFLRTGDLGFLKNDQLYIVGRIKDMIIVSGRNIAPQDIEFTAEQAHSLCRKGCSVAFNLMDENQTSDTVVIAIEIKKEAKTIEHNEILNAISHQVLAEHSIDNLTILLLPTRSILKTTSGKVRRQASKEFWLNHRLTVLASIQANNDNLSKDSKLTPIEFWAHQKLPLAVINKEQTLLDCGLTSMQAVALQKYIEQHYHKTPSLAFLLSRATLNSLQRWAFTQGNITQIDVVFTRQPWISELKNSEHLKQKERKAWKAAWSNFNDVNAQEITDELHKFGYSQENDIANKKLIIKKIDTAISFMLPTIDEPKKSSMINEHLMFTQWHQYWERNHRMKQPPQVMPHLTQTIQHWVDRLTPPHLLLCFHVSGWNIIFHQIIRAFSHSTQKLCLFSSSNYMLLEELSAMFAQVYGPHHPVRQLQEQNRLIFINPGDANELQKIQAAKNAGFVFIVMADPTLTNDRDDLYYCDIKDASAPFHTSLLDLLSFEGISVQTLFHYWNNDRCLSLHFSSVYQVQKTQMAKCNMTPLHEAIFKPIASMIENHLPQWTNLILFSQKKNDIKRHT